MKALRFSSSIGLAAWAASWIFSCGGRNTTPNGNGAGGAATSTLASSSVSSTTSSVSASTSSASVGSSSVGSASSSVGMGGLGGHAGSPVGGSGGAGGAPCSEASCCDPRFGPFEPVPVTVPTCSDFDLDAAPEGIQCVMPGGVWAIDTDGTGTPPAHGPVVIEPCGTSGRGLHFKGTGHTLWGADVAAAFVSQTQPVDASTFSGMSFVMRSLGGAVAVIFKVQSSYSQPPCGKCQDLVVGSECYSGYIKVIPLAPNGVAPIVVRWSDLTQQSWGYRPPGSEMFDPHDLVSVAFAFDVNVDFDVCIDDVEFIR